MSDFVCETCGKSYKSRSGLWKHQKKMLHGKFANSEKIGDDDAYLGRGDDPSQTTTHSDSKSDGVGSTIPPESRSDSDPPSDTPSFMDWDFGSAQDQEGTDQIPTAFKSIVKSPPMGSKKLSKAQYAALEKQNLGILKMGLTTIDVLLSKYGSVLHQDPEFKVAHSESDKDLVANAQYRYMEEKGLFLTNYLSTGSIALGLTTWYVAAPVIRIRKDAKRKFFKNGIMGRLPLIGRLFRRKKPEPSTIGQNVEVEIHE